MGSRSVARTVVSTKSHVLTARNETTLFRSHLHANLSLTKRLISALSLQRGSQVFVYFCRSSSTNNTVQARWYLHLFQAARAKRVAAYSDDLMRLRVHLDALRSANLATATSLETLSELQGELTMLDEWLVSKVFTWQRFSFAGLSASPDS